MFIWNFDFKYFFSELVDCKQSIPTSFLSSIKLIVVDVEAGIWDCKLDAIGTIF